METTFIIVFLLAAVAVYLLIKKKTQPKLGDTFTCDGCGKTVSHTRRTLKVSRWGYNKIFCSACFQNWYSTRPAEAKRPLTVIILIAIIALAVIALFSYLAN